MINQFLIARQIERIISLSGKQRYTYNAISRYATDAKSADEKNRMKSVRDVRSVQSFEFMQKTCSSNATQAIPFKFSVKNISHIYSNLLYILMIAVTQIVIICRMNLIAHFFSQCLRHRIDSNKEREARLKINLKLD